MSVSQKKNGTVFQKLTNSSAPRTIHRDSLRISASVTAGWKVDLCCQWKLSSTTAGWGLRPCELFSNLARLTGQDAQGIELSQDFEKQIKKLNDAFWLARKQRYAFALGTDGKPVDEPSVLATVPMWFGLTDQKNSSAMITQLAGVDHETDWGMRIISNRSPKFSGGGYHYGSVWPLFTGWASVGEYRYHRPQSAYDNLRANALLGLDGSLGHVTEVLSGDYYQPLSTSSPHQIWSAAMVVSPLLRACLALRRMRKQEPSPSLRTCPRTGIRSALTRCVLAKINCNWTLRGPRKEFFWKRVVPRGTGESTIEFRPAISLRATVQKAELNGKPLPFRVETNDEDQHVVVRFPVSEGQKFVRIVVVNDFGVTSTAVLPPLGSVSAGLRILSETWTASHDQLTLMFPDRREPNIN